MATKVLKSIKGRVIRFTRLDECGDPIIGACTTLVTDGFVKVTLSTEVENGQEFISKNAWGEFCINDKDPDIFKWVNTTIDLCAIDPHVLDMFAGADPVVSGADTIGVEVGTATNADAVAVEVWTKQTGADACAGGTVEWGYFLVSFVKNGRINGDVNIEAAPLTLQIVGQGFPSVAAWGENPYAAANGDNPLLVTGGHTTGKLWAQVVTSVQPPAVTAGCVALA